jgi:hypothetical protein
MNLKEQTKIREYIRKNFKNFLIEGEFDYVIAAKSAIKELSLSKEFEDDVLNISAEIE